MTSLDLSFHIFKIEILLDIYFNCDLSFKFYFYISKCLIDFSTGYTTKLEVTCEIFYKKNMYYENRGKDKQNIPRGKTAIINNNCLLHRKARKYDDEKKFLLHLAIQELQVQMGNSVTVLLGK